jgi:hypothetical protein
MLNVAGRMHQMALAEIRPSVSPSFASAVRVANSTLGLIQRQLYRALVRVYRSQLTLVADALDVTECVFALEPAFALFAMALESAA